MTIGLIVTSLFGLLFVLQEKMIFFPEKLPQDYQFHFASAFEEIVVSSKDGTKLHSLYFPLDSAKALVVYFHGNAGSLRGWGAVAEEFLQHGYAVLVTDYRGYGKSEGKISKERHLYEDADAIYQYAKSIYPEEKILLYGTSLGTGIAAYLASSNQPGRLILQSPYYSFQDLAKTLYPLAPRFLLRYNLPVHKYLAKANMPIHIVHGTEDKIIPIAQSEKLKAEFPDIDFVRVPGGGHNNLSSWLPDL